MGGLGAVGKIAGRHEKCQVACQVSLPGHLPVPRYSACKIIDGARGKFPELKSSWVDGLGGVGKIVDRHEKYQAALQISLPEHLPGRRYEHVKSSMAGVKIFEVKTERVGCGQDRG